MLTTSSTSVKARPRFALRQRVFNRKERKERKEKIFFFKLSMFSFAFFALFAVKNTCRPSEGSSKVGARHAVPVPCSK
ncbi:MAG: hypothetical protein NTX87_03960 [Planctomycetota bacterium]|nr:hypothetical protein [Planctomycetota bacterium]